MRDSYLEGQTLLSLGPDSSPHRDLPKAPITTAAWGLHAAASQERLKDAIEHERTGGVQSLEAGREGWAEYIFGIAKSDGRVGKHGSR